MRLFVVIATFSFAFSKPVLASCICVTCLLTGHENFIAVSGSMEPTMPVGACSKARHIDPGTYDFRRGDIIVFAHPGKAGNYVFRLIGLAGDQIQLRDGRVVLNGQVVPQSALADYEIKMEHQGPQRLLPRCPTPVALGETCKIKRMQETLPGGASYEILDLGDFPMDNTPLFRVPEQTVFVLGDNRDNAADSRLTPHIGGPGFVPLRNIIGVFEDLSPPG